MVSWLGCKTEMKKVYNKLVRDKIPEIIKQNGDSCVTHKLRVREFKTELLNKLVEESKEVSSAKNKDELIKELADLKEVMITIENTYKITASMIEKVRKERNRKRGGFKKRVFLIETN